ncbi:hypothetical protein [Marinibacterium sp. SX1]
MLLSIFLTALLLAGWSYRLVRIALDAHWPPLMVAQSVGAFLRSAPGRTL